MLITEIAANDPEQVVALVYMAAFIPRAGGTVGQLDTQFPARCPAPDTTCAVDYPGGTDTCV